MRVVALDLARFFAAISVVLYHYVSRPGSEVFPLLRHATDFGYLGVSLFFMISGYVISLSATNRSAAEFAVSRFTRLYPALWVGVIITVVISSVLTDGSYSLLQVLVNFTLLQDYLGFSDVDGVYWTLKEELKFYACIYLLLLVGVFNKYYIWLSAWLFVTTMHAFIGQPFFMGWFISPSYSCFFIAGVALFLIQSSGVNKFNGFIFITSLLLSSYHGYVQAGNFISNVSTEQQWIAVLLIGLFYLVLYLLFTGKVALEPKRIYITLGALTYPLYLIHNVAGKAIIDSDLINVSERVEIFLVVLFMLFISWLICVCVEKPFAGPLKNYLLSICAKNRFSK